MRINDITLDDIKMHLRIDHNEEDLLLIDKLEIAKAYIKDYTGLTDELMKDKELLSEIALKIVTDLYENRATALDTKESIRVNKIYESMLNMYCINLL